MEATSLSNKVLNWSPTSKKILTGVAVVGAAVLITGVALLILKLHAIQALSLTAGGGAVVGLGIIYFIVLQVRKHLTDSKPPREESKSTAADDLTPNFIADALRKITNVKAKDELLKKNKLALLPVTITHAEEEEALKVLEELNAEELETCFTSLIEEKDESSNQNNIKKIKDLIAILAKDATRNEQAKKYITSIYLISAGVGCDVFLAYLEILNECKTEENESERAIKAHEFFKTLNKSHNYDGFASIRTSIQKNMVSFGNGVIALFYFRAFKMENEEFKIFLDRFPALIFNQLMPLLDNEELLFMMKHFQAEKFLDKKKTLTIEQMANDDFASAVQPKFDSIYAGMTDEQKAKYPEFAQVYLHPFKPLEVS